MGIFNLFGKRTKEQPPQKNDRAGEAEELDIYSGIRVEVTTPEGRLLFVAKLLGLHGDKEIGRASCRERVYRLV